MGLFNTIDQAIDEKFPERKDELKKNLQDYLTEKIEYTEIKPELYALLLEVDEKLGFPIKKAGEQIK